MGGRALPSLDPAGSAWDPQTPEQPSPSTGSLHIPNPTSAWFGPSTYRHHGLWWTQVGQVTNANNEGPAGGKVVAPTFQDAITQLEELGSNRATGSRATRHQYPVPPPLLSYFLSPFPELCLSLPLLIYTPLWPRPVSNTHVVLSHLCFFAPTTPCLEQNSSQPVTEASVSFTSKTSLLPCSVCLDPEFPRNAILKLYLTPRMNVLSGWY